MNKMAGSTASRIEIMMRSNKPILSACIMTKNHCNRYYIMSPEQMEKCWGTRDSVDFKGVKAQGFLRELKKNLAHDGNVYD